MSKSVCYIKRDNRLSINSIYGGIYTESLFKNYEIEMKKENRKRKIEKILLH
jgi:hypothetical protein